jgi:hypothetical protein
MAEFCGVSTDTALRWNARRLPNGGTLNKLWFLLEAHGLEVKELKKVLPEVRYIAKLVAFEVLTKEAALTELKLEGATDDYLWRVLQGKLVPLAIQKKIVTLKRLSQKHGSALQAALPSAGVASTPAGSRPAKPPVPIEVTASDSHIPVAAAFLSGLHPLVRRIVADGEESILSLRSEVSDDDFYAVLDGLKAMASRRARQFYTGE